MESVTVERVGERFSYIAVARKLLKIFEKLLQQHVHFLENLPEQDLLNLYASSKIILSTAHFEPFGMSVAEGMMLRAVPVVYKGSLSGPWMDIVDKGRYGIGFRTIEEFAESIEYIMNANGTELSELQEKAYKGSQRFSFDKFERNITRLLK
jgi:glycosyltransferase involved in cell wall biosynthesis